MTETNELCRRVAKSVAVVVLGVASVALATGCEEEKVSTYNSPKETAKAPEAKPAEAKPSEVKPADATPVAAAAADPKADAPKADAPKTDAPKADAPKADEVRAFTVGALSAKVPTKWNQDLRQRMMREATFVVGDPEKKTEVIITKLNGPAGGLLENVNRWRGQVGLGPVAEVKEADLPKVKIAGKDSYVVDVAGPDEKAPTKRQIQAVSAQDDGTYYIKIIGDAALVAENKAAFDAFLSSIEFKK